MHDSGHYHTPDMTELTINAAGSTISPWVFGKGGLSVYELSVGIDGLGVLEVDSSVSVVEYDDLSRSTSRTAARSSC